MIFSLLRMANDLKIQVIMNIHLQSPSAKWPETPQANGEDFHEAYWERYQ